MIIKIQLLLVSQPFLNFEKQKASYKFEDLKQWKKCKCRFTMYTWIIFLKEIPDQKDSTAYFPLISFYFIFKN